MRFLNPTRETVSEFGTDRAWPVIEKAGAIMGFKPETDFRVYHDEYIHRVHTDAFGGRESGPCNLMTRKIVFPIIGDSFTFGLGVDDNETFVSQLNHKINQCMLNLGIPGSSLQHQMNIIRRRHEELISPKLYIFAIFLGNDIVFEESAANSTKAKRNSMSGIRELLHKVNDFLYHHSLLKRSYFIQFLRSKLLVFYNRLVRRQGGSGEMDPVFYAMDISRKKDARKIIERDFDDLEQLAAQKKFDYAVVMIPDRHQINKNLRNMQVKIYGLHKDEIDASQPNQLYAGVLRRRKRPYLDISRCLKAQGEGRNIYYTQDNHFTPEGHKIAADCMLPWLEEQIHKY